MALRDISRGCAVNLRADVTADVDAAVAANGTLRLMGYSVRENKATAAVAAFSIVNGATGAAAGKVVYVEKVADSSETQWFGPDGIACPLGISIDFESGEFDIAIYYKTETTPA